MSESNWVDLIRASTVRRSLRAPPFLGRAKVVANLVEVDSLKTHLRAGAILDVDADAGFALDLKPGLWFVYVGHDSRTFFWGRLAIEDRDDTDEITLETAPADQLRSATT